MPTLQNAVANSEAKPLELRIIRLAKEMTVTVTPEKMPKEIAEARAEAGAEPGPFNFEFQNSPLGDVEDLLKQFQFGAGGGMRIVGPGMIVRGQAFDLNKMPGGVSVSVAREGDAPAQVTVKKGDQTWNFQGDDQAALAKLPDDVRPFVEKMLGAQQGRPLVKQFQLGQGFDPQAVRQRADEASKRILKQMEQMEQRMQEMQRRFDERFPAEPANPAADPSKT
jgi:hypothetical protein